MWLNLIRFTSICCQGNCAELCWIGLMAIFKPEKEDSLIFFCLVNLLKDTGPKEVHFPLVVKYEQQNINISQYVTSQKADYLLNTVFLQTSPSTCKFNQLFQPLIYCHYVGTHYALLVTRVIDSTNKNGPRSLIYLLNSPIALLLCQHSF